MQKSHTRIQFQEYIEMENQSGDALTLPRTFPGRPTSALHTPQSASQAHYSLVLQRALENASERLQATLESVSDTYGVSLEDLRRELTVQLSNCPIRQSN